METTTNSHKAQVIGFLKQKGFVDDQIHDIFKRCNKLETIERASIDGNWNYLTSIGIQERKLPRVISKCPKILTLSLDNKLIPTVNCLLTLGSKPSEVSSAIVKFPNVLSHSVEDKLCPLLAFFQSLGIQDKQVGKLLLLNPRLISYSIESKFSKIVEFLESLGLDQSEMIGKILLKHPFIMGYSVERRLKPTVEFLKSIGLNEIDVKKVAMNFPEVLCRDVEKILRPNSNFLKRCGFNKGQLAMIVTGYPLVLIKSVKNCLEPRIKFLVQIMGRDIGEITEYPEFFRHGLKKNLEFRYKLLKEKNASCSLVEMLDCNKRKFFLKYGAWSNGRLHNVKHRVQCKKAVWRFSIALFLLAPKDDIVEPPPTLADSEHPRLYKTFTYDEYRKLRLSSGSRAGEALSLLAQNATNVEA
ncbi:uncharacterized protein A4U43_C01F33700 [Asparagus officinalis]|uniref:Uncharacterized protein n=1 Tax=Asparagus officinalis TaxID=4686 RepID=A0A5P1FWV4_ASPOF|nr:uncharacterized protein A4U43_C01F33700 [Asparagus officinalis]